MLTGKNNGGRGVAIEINRAQRRLGGKIILNCYIVKAKKIED